MKNFVNHGGFRFLRLLTYALSKFLFFGAGSHGKSGSAQWQFIPILLSITLVFMIIPGNACATQMHTGSEGIIVHQLGHLFFLFSMVIIIFAINGKGLDKEKGWRLIQYSALLFILWNIDAMSVHLLDNQIQAVNVEQLSSWTIKITSINKSSALDFIYYILKLDHIFCVPAMFLLYKGLSIILETERKKQKHIQEN